MGLERVRDDGTALEWWARSIKAMGGDPRVTEAPETVLAQAPFVREIKAQRSGTLTGFDVRQVGMTVVELGGGRTQPDAVIDPSVGLSQIALAGTECRPGDTLAVVHACNEDEWNRAEARFLSALEWEGTTATPNVIRGRIGQSS